MATGGKGKESENRDRLPPQSPNNDAREPDTDTELGTSRPPSGVGDQEWVRVKDIKELCGEMRKCFKSALWALRKDLDALGERTNTLEIKSDENVTALQQTNAEVATLPAQKCCPFGSCCCEDDPVQRSDADSFGAPDDPSQFLDQRPSSLLLPPRLSGNLQMALNIISHNVKGLNSPIKRKLAFTEYKRRGADILMLQETHFSDKSSPRYMDKQYSQFYLSSALEKKKGIAILFHNKIPFTAKIVKKDKEVHLNLDHGPLPTTLQSPILNLSLNIYYSTFYYPRPQLSVLYNPPVSYPRQCDKCFFPVCHRCKLFQGDRCFIRKYDILKLFSTVNPCTCFVIAPGGHVSPEMEQVSSPGSASSTLLEEHHGDEDDEYDEDDATEETEIQSCDHEEVPIETVVPPNRPSTSTYDAIVASEGKIVDAENRRHSDMMTVLERMIGLQEETVSQLAHLHRVFIEVPKQLQKINTSFEALVVQQTQANYWRMTNVPQFNTSQPGSVHAGQFSPHSSDIHSPGPNVTGQVADIAVQVPDDILPLPSVQIQQQTPTKEATKTKQDTHETDQPSLVQCLPTCSHVSLGTSPVREQSLPKSPVGESLPKSPVGESLPKSPVGESLPKSPVGESLPKSPVGESLPKSPVGESLAKSPVGESLATSPVGEQSLATSPAREVPEATQSGSVVPKVGGKRKRKIQETTSRPVTRSQKEQKK
ncbi:uncharacterized protein LOC142488090 [Ascaphus truei]|uniref:uncharacterized protein LOC142488090 n=1 Tax=Ascaphus truei TaxID=8439 RepID=UPI003F5A333C